MTATNAELARGAIGDLARFFELLDEDIVWDNSAYAPLDQSGVFRGKARVIQVITDYMNTWKDFRFEVREVVEAGDDVILVVRETALGRGSGAPMEHDYAQRWTFRDGRVVNAKSYASKADAVREAGA